MDGNIGSRRDLIPQACTIPKTSSIITIDENIQQYQPYQIHSSESNQSISIQFNYFLGNQTTSSKGTSHGELERRIESIINTVIIEKTVNSSVNKSVLKEFLFQKVKTMGLERFQQLPDDVIKKRIEKVVIIELLKNLFLDLSDEELDLIKTHTKGEGFFR